MSVKRLAISFIAFTVLFSLIGPLGIAGLRAGEFRALPLDSLEKESAHFEKRLEATSKGPLNSADRFRILTLARSYHTLGLFDVSETWFLRLGKADHDSFYEEAVFNGLLLCALGKGEWDRAEELIDVEGGPTVEVDEAGILRLLRQMAGSGRNIEALALIDILIEQGTTNSTAQVLDYKGVLLRRMGRIEDASIFYENLINKLKVPDTLHRSVPESRELFRQGAADTAFLLNDRIRSRQHYLELRYSSDTETRNWARFQLAQLDMLDNGYEDAEVVFASIGPDSLWEPASIWAIYLREHASAMKLYSDLLPDNRPPAGEERP